MVIHEDNLQCWFMTDSWFLMTVYDDDDDDDYDDDHVHRHCILEPQTTNNSMDVWWNIHFSRKEWESSIETNHLGVSKNRGTPKWRVFNGKPY